MRLRVWYAFVYFTRYKSVISKRKRRGAEQQSRLVNESVGEAKPLRIAKVRELFQSSLFGIQWVVGEKNTQTSAVAHNGWRYETLGSSKH